jgi:hypothetical protein
LYQNSFGIVRNEMCRPIHIRMAGHEGYIAVPVCLLLLQVTQSFVRCENKCKDNSEMFRTVTERASQIGRLSIKYDSILVLFLLAAA